jgi:hypothetical protein
VSAEADEEIEVRSVKSRKEEVRYWAVVSDSGLVMRGGGGEVGQGAAPWSISALQGQASQAPPPPPGPVIPASRPTGPLLSGRVPCVAFGPGQVPGYLTKHSWYGAAVVLMSSSQGQKMGTGHHREVNIGVGVAPDTRL